MKKCKVILVHFITLMIFILSNVLISGAWAAPPSGVTMQVEPYFSGHFKFGEWLPLRVTLANDGPAIHAEVRADTLEAGGQTTYIAPVELPAGARKRITLYVQPPSFAQAVRVRLMEGTRELASQKAQVTVERNVNFVIGVIAPRVEPFAVLGGLTLNPQPDTPPFGPSGPQNPRPVKVVPISLSDIPDRPEGLRVLDALVISSVDTSGLSPEQAYALQGWVGQGGRLVLGGGAGAARTLAGMPSTLVSDLLSPGITAELQSLDALGKFAGENVRVPGPFAVTWPNQSSGDLSAHLRPTVIVDQDGQALLTERHFGEGYVNYAALDLAGSPFDAWAGVSRFWEKLLTPGSAYPVNLPQDVSPRLMRANSLSYVLQNLPALGLPSIRWLAGLLAVYILLAGPVNYVILRRLRKLEWGWITIPALTLAFSIGAFALGFSMRGGDVIVNKISILNFDARGPAAPMQTYVGIFSPARRAYTLNLPGRALASPISMDGNPWGGGGMPGPGALDIVQGDPAQVRGVQVNQWTLQSFQTESPIPDGWEFESDLVFDGDRLHGTLVNRTGVALTDAAIVSGNRFVRLGELPSGQNVAIDHVLQNAANAAFPYFLYQDVWQNMGPNGPPVELQMRQQILDGYYGGMKGSTQSPSQTTLIGWTRTSPLDVQVTGVRWATQQTGLVIASLNVRYPPGPIHLSGSSLPASLVSSQGDAYVCGATFNQVYINTGGAVLEFQAPEDQANIDITRLALMIQLDGNLPVVEIYDRNGEWVKLDSPRHGRNELTDPARFILANGIVRVQLSGAGLGSCLLYELDLEGSVN